VYLQISTFAQKILVTFSNYKSSPSSVFVCFSLCYIQNAVGSYIPEAHRGGLHSYKIQTTQSHMNAEKEKNG